MCNDKLHYRRQKLDAIKETGKSHIWPYLRATKWRRDWTPDVLSQLLHTLVLTRNWSITDGCYECTYTHVIATEMFWGRTDSNFNVRSPSFQLLWNYDAVTMDHAMSG